jgi:hypothetical protein
LVPQFNALWLDPINPDTFPAGLLDAVTASTAAAGAGATATAITPAWSGEGEERSLEERLREQMRADALQPLGDDDDDDDDVVASSPKNADYNSESHLPPKWIEDATQFLRLNVSITYDPSAAVVSLARHFFSPSRWQYLADNLCQARGTFGQHFGVFACGISLLFLVWHTV